MTPVPSPTASAPGRPSGAVVGPPALEAIGASRRFGRTQALHDVTLAIPAGSIAALVGPNGAGKSTLIRCWVGFERPDTGSVRVLGADPASDRAGAHRRQRVGDVEDRQAHGRASSSSSWCSVASP